jgi:hypothetical protein
MGHDFDEAMRELDRQDDPGRAVADLERQVEEGGGHFYNLSRMWRACGRPPDRTPEIWQGLARPLVDGVAAYLRALDEHKGRPARERDGEVIFTMEPDPDYPTGPEDDWRPGDVLALHYLARTFAWFLDEVEEPRLPRDPLPWQGG